jgi:hypothetical protein
LAKSYQLIGEYTLRCVLIFRSDRAWFHVVCWPSPLGLALDRKIMFPRDVVGRGKACGKFRIRRSIIVTLLRRSELHDALTLDAKEFLQLRIAIKSSILK